MEVKRIPVLLTGDNYFPFFSLPDHIDYMSVGLVSGRRGGDECWPRGFHDRTAWVLYPLLRLLRSSSNLEVRKHPSVDSDSISR